MCWDIFTIFVSFSLISHYNIHVSSLWNQPKVCRENTFENFVFRMHKHVSRQNDEAVLWQDCFYIIKRVFRRFWCQDCEIFKPNCYDIISGFIKIGLQPLEVNISFTLQYMYQYKKCTLNHCIYSNGYLLTVLTAMAH